MGKAEQTFTEHMLDKRLFGQQKSDDDEFKRYKNRLHHNRHQGHHAVLDGILHRYIMKIFYRSIMMLSIARSSI